MLPLRLRPLLLALACALALTGLAACDSGEDGPGAEPPALPRTVPPAAYDTTDSGLLIHDFTEGEGPAAAPGDRLTVEYTGWLRSDSTRFDSSVGRRPFVFVLNTGQVIAGWDEGVRGMRVGGERSLVIPPHLGYGEDGSGGAIPPDATLIFEIELLDLVADE
jgi:FKBP-type peptidyl-prolyl cis-trans isomerase